MTLKEYILNEETNIKTFIKNIKKYKDLDTALLKLPDEYTEFYLKNINNKELNKQLKKLNLVEDMEQSKNQTLGTSPTPGKFKKLHYKGHYLVLKYDEDLGWIGTPSFRDITSTLRYVKKLADLTLD